MLGNLSNNQSKNRNVQQNNNTQMENSLVYNANIKNNVENKTAAGVQKKDVTKAEKKEDEDIGSCKTCSERRYQDGSDDSGVSFQSPTRINPQQTAAMVRSHENEHYSREATKAKIEDKDVLVNNIRLHSAVCPDCGKIYVSGGETTTVTKTRGKDSPSPLEEVQEDGLNLDLGV